MLRSTLVLLKSLTGGHHVETDYLRSRRSGGDFIRRGGAGHAGEPAAQCSRAGERAARTVLSSPSCLPARPSRLEQLRLQTLPVPALLDRAHLARLGASL